MKTRKQNRPLNYPFTTLPNEVLLSPNLSTQTKVVYGVISSYNPSHPTFNYLKQICSIGKDTLRACIKELLARNLIVIINKGYEIVCDPKSWHLESHSQYEVGDIITDEFGKSSNYEFNLFLITTKHNDRYEFFDLISGSRYFDKDIQSFSLYTNIFRGSSSKLNN